MGKRRAKESKKMKDTELNIDAIIKNHAAVVDNSDRMLVNEATVADIDEAIYETVFTRALSQTPRSLRGANTVEARLKRLNFTDAEGRVIRAGLLVAGVYPQQFFPKLHVDVAVHPGTEKSIGGALRFRDRVK